MNIASINSFGRPTNTAHIVDSQNAPSGPNIILMPDGIDDSDLIRNYSYDGANWVKRPTGTDSTYELVGGAWVDIRAIDSIRSKKRAEIDAAVTDANQGSFFFQGSEFQCDAQGRSYIDGMNGIVTLLNALPPNWIGKWKARDNTFLPIPDLNSWIGFYGSMVAQGQANFFRSQTLKAMIAGATSNTQLDAISWTTVI